MIFPRKSEEKCIYEVIFIATYMETASASGKLGCWRKQAACCLNGLCVIDFDHVDEGVQTTPPDGTPPNLGGERVTTPDDSGGERLRAAMDAAPKVLFDCSNVNKT